MVLVDFKRIMKVLNNKSQINWFPQKYLLLENHEDDFCRKGHRLRISTGSSNT